MHSCLLQAQILFDNRTTHKISPAFYDALLVVGILLGLSAIIFVIVALSRKTSLKKHRRSRRPEILENTRQHLQEKEEAAPDSKPAGGTRRRKRKRRREPRHRNPTLAELDGLPPIREKEPPSDPGT